MNRRTGYSKTYVRAVCTDCGNEWDADVITEYGASWLEPREDCAQCGSTQIDTDPLDAIDIQERKLEARGYDF